MKYVERAERAFEQKKDYRVSAYMVNEHTAQALKVDVYRKSDGDSSNNGISKRFDSLLVIGVEGGETVDLDNPPENAVWLLEKPRGELAAPFYCVAPLDSVDCGGDVLYVNGGNMCATSDSRWRIRYAVAVLDRDEAKKTVPVKDNLMPFELMLICPVGKQDKVRELIKREIKNGGYVVEKVDEWGERRLAYEIGDYETGYYMLFTFLCDNEGVRAIDKVSRNTNDILRHMIIRKGE